MKAMCTKGGACALGWLRAVVVLLAWPGVWACEEGPVAEQAQAHIQKEHLPRVRAIIADDFERHKQGLTYAAKRVAKGFVEAAPERQEREMRQVLKLVRSPKRGVQQLVISPMSFLAAVRKDGLVIARDTEPDPMKGMDLGAQFEIVRQALAGNFSEGVAEFAATQGEESSVTWLMAAPAMQDGEVVGALVLGIPLWRLAQRLSKQLQIEAGAGTVVWVYLFRGDRLFHHGTPPDLDTIVPDAAVRRQGLATQPQGFFGGTRQFGFEYGYGVQLLPAVGEDVGVIVMRMES